MRQAFSERLHAAKQGTHAVVDLDRFYANIQQIVESLQDEPSAELMAVLKANAYGHGLVPCAFAAVDAGVAWVGVARIEEAMVLRRAGIDLPILVLGPPNPGLAQAAAEQGITLAIGSHDLAKQILSNLPADSLALDVHVKVDTGMHRYGADPSDTVDLVRALQAEPRLTVSGLFTHFATADAPDDRFLSEQMQRFTTVWQAVTNQGLDVPLVHFANSGATIRGLRAPEGATGRILYRVGLALYGQSPSADVPVPEGFERVLSLKTRLGRVFTLQPGEGVSYGLTYVADRQVRCGTVPVGYGDGLSRLLSNQGWMTVNGQRCPILGRVCMDQTVISLDAVPDVGEGDEVIVYGDGRAGDMTPDDIAGMCGTINYVVVTALQARVPRIYVSDGVPAAVQDLAGYRSNTDG